jgi:hypothetical protein
VLTDSGATIAVHDVTLEMRAWQFEAFTGLPGYLRLAVIGQLGHAGTAGHAAPGV